MIIEGIVTTEGEDGGLHVAPIGPHVNPELSQWTLKPFQTSTTFANLRRTNRCVFHVVDDALLMARAVLGLCNVPENFPKASFDAKVGWILRDTCRYVALQVVEWDVSTERAAARCAVAGVEELRSAWGWNRAAHSVLELSILASRRHMLPQELLAEELERHRTIIEKTAGPRESAAWELLKPYLMRLQREQNS